MWLFILLVLFSCPLQSSLMPVLRVFSVRPDLLLLAVFISGMHFSLRAAVVLSIFCGVLKDLLAVSPLGINTLIFPLLGFLIFKLSRKISIEDNVVYSAVCFAATFFYEILYRAASEFLGSHIPGFMFLRIAFLEAAYNALFFPLLLRFFRPIIALP